MKFKVLLFIFILHLAPWSKANTPDGLGDFLQGFVSEISKNDIDFFYASPPKDDHVYVYWMTGNSILIVNLPTERLENYDWYDYKARIDLNTDVIPTADDIGGSTYLTSSDWVEERLKECLNGKKYIIRKAEVEQSSTAHLD